CARGGYYGSRYFDYW
nr:immunoglobulin heavy chain junction region [Mus musculus]MBK4198215.1 immunoglobulin heavy chain junction region [Mus musculus]